MGINDLFTNSSDLSGLLEGTGVRVSKVIQKAFIEIDEGGASTEAAEEVFTSKICQVSHTLSYFPFHPFQKRERECILSMPTIRLSS